MRYPFLFLLPLLMLPPNARGQLFDSEVYHVNPYIDGAITLATAATSYWGMVTVDKKPPLDSNDIARLDANDINPFDRSATKQDPNYMHTAWKISADF